MLPDRRVQRVDGALAQDPHRFRSGQHLNPQGQGLAVIERIANGSNTDIAHRSERYPSRRQAVNRDARSVLRRKPLGSLPWPQPPWVIVIDDEAGSRQSMAIALERAGLRVRVFDDAEPALAFVEREPKVRLAVCDLRMPGMDGLAFLNRVRAQELDLAVILVTGFGTIESAVEAMRVGADDYLTKPVDLYELRSRVLKLIENWQLRDEVTNLREMLDERFGFDAIVGQSAAMEQLFQQMRQVAPSRASVLILGESGTGKELVAKALHQASDRRQERFLALNCGAIPNDILESELFGHEKGSFTGAVGRKIGKFELAARGTLFLDEISELIPELQVKLLRVLEERQIMRVGGSKMLDVDFRLLAATNRNLEEAVEQGVFREDLYYRLKVVTLRIPPLRDRLDDLPLLADHFLREFAAREGKPEMQLSGRALSCLAQNRWQGNVRELRNVLETVAVFHGGGRIEVGDLPEEIRQAAEAPAEAAVQTSFGEPRTMAEIERHAILQTLDRTGGKRAEAARLLGIGVRTLQRKLKDYRERGAGRGLKASASAGCAGLPTRCRRRRRRHRRRPEAGGRSVPACAASRLRPEAGQRTRAPRGQPCMASSISATAAGMPIRTARDTMEWPMFSSLTPGRAATRPTLATVRPCPAYASRPAARPRSAAASIFANSASASPPETRV